MKRFLTAFAAIALALAALAPAPALASAQLMCQGDVSGASTGSRVVVVATSTATPQTSYVLNSAGCAVIQLADIGYFQSLGFSQPGPQQSLVFNVGVATGTTDFIVATLPAGTYIRDIFVSNSVAAAVTGGISFGTTANGTDIVAALAVGSSAAGAFVTDALLLKRTFSLTAQQAIHAAAVTAWNSTNVTVTIVYAYY